MENVPNDGSRQDYQLTLGHPLSDGLNSVVASPKDNGQTRTAAKKALGASTSADNRGMVQRIPSKKTEQTFVVKATTKQSGASNVNSGDIMSIDQNSSLGNEIDL